MHSPPFFSSFEGSFFISFVLSLIVKIILLKWQIALRNNTICYFLLGFPLSTVTCIVNLLSSEAEGIT